MDGSDVHSPVGLSYQEREDIIQMIEWGWSNEQILEMLPHITLGSVAAYRAHVTRGTYLQGYETWNSKRRA